MNGKQWWIVLGLLIGVSFGLRAETSGWRYRNYDVEDGLSHNTVHCALQDSYGFLWFGTTDGLNCFDGYTFRTFRTLPDDPSSLSGNHVLALGEDGRSNLWIGTNEGVCIWDRTTGRFAPFRARTRYGVTVSSEVRSILAADDGRMWIATLGQGLFIYNLATEELTQDSRHSSFLWTLCQTAPDTIYAPSLRRGLLRLAPDGSCLEDYPFPFPENGQHIGSLCEADGRLWMGVGDTYLCSFECASGRFEAIPVPATATGSIRSLLAYRPGQLLVGTDGGLFLFDRLTHDFRRIDRPDDGYGPNDFGVNGLLRDREGGIWFLTQHRGLSYLAAPDNPFGRSPALSVRAFCEDAARRRVWLGTAEGLFYRHEGETELHAWPLRAADGSAYDVRTLWLDEQTLWVGTKGQGLLRIDLSDGHTTHYTHRPERPHSVCGNEVLSLCRTRGGTLYVGTSWGLCVYIPEADHFQTVLNVGFMTAIVDIYEDSHQYLWFVTADKGVFCYNMQDWRWTQFRHDGHRPGTLTSDAVLTVHEDSRGTVWFGTDGSGLCSFRRETESFSAFDPDNRIAALRTVSAIEEDEAGHFWVSGNAGLVCLDPETGEPAGRYLEADGLQGNRFHPRASLRTADGQLYFGGPEGFNTFSPAAVQADDHQAPTRLTGIRLADDTSGTDTLLSRRPLYLQQEITLPYRCNSFTISFATLNYRASYRNQYVYRLHGADPAWSDPSDRAQAVYTHLSPGRYRFELKGCDRVLTIVVRPPWWRSPWAYAAYVSGIAALAVLSAGGWNRYVQRKYRRRMEEFRLQKEKDTYESKIRFFVNLVHEIRTPLTLISLPLEQLEARRNGEDEGRYLRSIRRNVDYLTGITNELMDFEKLENNVLHPCRLELREVLESVAGQFAEAAAARGLALDCSLPASERWAVADREKLGKILVNLLGNALKYAGGRIVLSLTDGEAGDYLIRVTDDGPGIPEADRPHVFELFFQSESTRHTVPGTGLGLPFARSLAEAMGGTLQLEETPRGCSFLLSLPAAVGTRPAAEVVSLPAEPDVAADADSVLPRGRFTLLLVEDNAELLKLTAASLRHRFRVVEARDGLEALQQLENEQVDVVVSDVMMPGMDGLELCGRIKSDVDYSHIPVVLLTAKTTLQAKTEGMERGADAYMEKPFTLRQLHRQVENLLRLRMAFHQSVVALSGTASPAPEADASLSRRDRDLLAEIRRAVEGQMADEQFSIDLLADQLHMSRSSFYRKLKGLTGLSPTEFLRTMRLNRAAELLKEGERTGEVYARVGFGSASYFAKCFKERFGVLPRDFKEGGNA